MYNNTKAYKCKNYGQSRVNDSKNAVNNAQSDAHTFDFSNNAKTGIKSAKDGSGVCEGICTKSQLLNIGDAENARLQNVATLQKHTNKNSNKKEKYAQTTLTRLAGDKCIDKGVEYMNQQNKVTNKINNKALSLYKETVQHNHATLSILMWLLAVCIGLTMLIVLPNNTNNRAISLNATGGGITGTGNSAEDPFIINDAQDLIAFADSNNSATYWASGTYAKLGADITLTANDLSTNGLTNTDGTYTWAPIGTDSNTPYQGTFDGDGHKITFSNQIKISNKYIGLLGYVGTGSTIQNLSVNWQGGLTQASSSGSIYVGGIAGYVNGTLLIINCCSSGEIKASASFASIQAGGLLGFASNATIEKCGNNSNVISVVTDNVNAGGIAGQLQNSAVSNCYNNGLIQVKSTSDYTGSRAGGITAFAKDTNFDGCYNTGSINTNAALIPETGGVVGDTSSTGTISNCYNIGDIISNSREYVAYAGGIVGSTGYAISNCYNMGTISAISTSDEAYAGGIVGSASSTSTVNSCFSILGTNDSISATGTTTFLGPIGGNVASSPTNCYYDILPTGATNENGTLNTQLATLVKELSSFETGGELESLGWSFSAIWGVNPNYNGGLPDLRVFYDNYTITYQYSQSDTSQNQTQTINQLDHLEYTNTYFPREGYTYTQWTDGENYYDVGSLINLTDNITVWPVWVEVAIDFTITLNQSTESTGTPNNIFVYLVVNDSVVKQSFLSSGLVLSAQATASSTISIIVTGGYMTSVTLTGENGEQVGNRFVLNDLSHTSITITYMVTVPNTNTGFNNSIII